MIAFWAVAGVFAAAAAGLVLFRAARVAVDETGDLTSDVYRRQLAEIDDLAERGLIGPGERKSAHAEAARRLLVAADAPCELWSAQPNGRQLVLVVARKLPLACDIFCSNAHVIAVKGIG